MNKTITILIIILSFTFKSKAQTYLQAGLKGGYSINYSDLNGPAFGADITANFGKYMAVEFSFEDNYFKEPRPQLFSGTETNYINHRGGAVHYMHFQLNIKVNIISEKRFKLKPIVGFCFSLPYKMPIYAYDVDLGKEILTVSFLNRKAVGFSFGIEIEYFISKKLSLFLQGKGTNVYLDQRPYPTINELVLGTFLGIRYSFKKKK